MARFDHPGLVVPQSDAVPMHFDLVDIKLFLNIAEKQSLTQGAEHSYISPPAASVRIKNIEERLGTKLLRRTSQGVSPTDAGKAFLHYGRLVLRQLEDLHHELRQCAMGTNGRLRILGSARADAELPPEVLSSFLSTHSNVTVELREAPTPEIIRALASESADIGIVEGVSAAEGLEVFPYRRERLVLATPWAHALAHRQQVHFEEALGFDHITVRESNPFRGLAMEAARAMEGILKIRVQVCSYEALGRMVESGVGISVLPDSTARRLAKSMALRTIGIIDESAIRELHICVRRLESLPVFARKLISLLLAESPPSQ